MTVSIERKRAILDSAKGQFFYVEFKKADGTVRKMKAKKKMEDAFTYGSANARVSTTAHKPEMYRAVDVDLFKVDPKKSYRTINLDELLSATVAGVTYTFN